MSFDSQSAIGGFGGHVSGTWIVIGVKYRGLVY